MYDDYLAGKRGLAPRTDTFTPMYWAGKIAADREHFAKEQESLHNEGQGVVQKGDFGFKDLLLIPLLPLLLFLYDILTGWNVVRVIAAIIGGACLALLIGGLFMGFQFEGSSEVIGTWLMRIGVDLFVLALIPRIYIVFAALMSLALQNWATLEPYGLLTVLIKYW